MALYGLSWAVAAPVAGLVSSALAGVVGLPSVIAASACLAFGLHAAVLLRAGGGIGRVVEACAGEYGTVLHS